MPLGFDEARCQDSSSSLATGSTRSNGLLEGIDIELALGWRLSATKKQASGVAKGETWLIVRPQADF